MKQIETQVVRNEKGQFTSDPRPDKRKGKYLPCKRCGTIEYVPRAKSLLYKENFCSRKCYWEWMKGKPSNIKGKKLSEEARRRISQGGIGKHVGEKNASWKGDDVGYVALHEWVSRNLGKANNCFMKDISCKGKFEWANKSQEYKRDLSDWMQLCKSHHTRYDRGTLSLEQVRQIKIFLKDGERQYVIAKKFNISSSVISNISTGKIWSHI